MLRLLRQSRNNLALISVFLLFGANSLWSQATRSSPLLTLVVEVSVNGVSIGQNAIILQDAAGGFFVTASDLDRWNLRTDLRSEQRAIVADGEKYFSLKDYPDLHATLDTQSLTLHLNGPGSVFRENVIDVRKLAPKRIRPQNAGFYLNYDLSYSGPEGGSLGALTDTTVFSPFGVGKSYFSITDINQNPSLVRLATTWTVDQPETMSTLRFGDSITSAPSYSSGVQFAGIQWERNFGTRPDFLQIPGLSLEGIADIPSSMDLFLNQVKTWGTDLGPGPFRISGIPIITGSGEAVIRSTDLLGRQRVWLIPYYTGGSLLEKDLSDYSVSLGLVRKNLGTESFNYSDFLGVVRYRRGLSRSLTLSVNGEFLRLQQMLGLDYDFALGDFALAKASLALSNSAVANGYLLSLGLQRSSSGLSFGSSLSYATQGFRDLRYLGISSVPPALQAMCFLSANTFLGGLSSSFSYLQAYNGPNTAILTLNYSKNIFEGVSLQANSVFDLLGAGLTGFFASLSFDMDPFGYANASLQSNGNAFTPQIGLSSNSPSGPGYHYDLSATGGSEPSANASVGVITNYADFNFSASLAPQSLNWQLDAAGGIVWMKDSIFFSRPIGSSFALVSIPELPGIRILKSNDFIGYTNRDGIILVSDLSPYQRNSLELDLGSLPIDAVASGPTELEIEPYFASGNIVQFDVRRSHSATMRLMLAKDRPVPSGAFAYFQENSEKFPVADKGTVYLKGLKENNHILVQYGDERCELNFEFHSENETIPFLGSFFCLPLANTSTQ